MNQQSVLSHSVMLFNLLFVGDHSGSNSPKHEGICLNLLKKISLPSNRLDDFQVYGQIEKLTAQAISE